MYGKELAKVKTKLDLQLKEFQGSPYRDMDLVEMCQVTLSKLDELKPDEVFTILADE